MTKEQILIGYAVGSGDPVYMSHKHTMITGMTGDAGKTTCIEGIASRWSGQKFVVFLAKPGEEAFKAGRRILPFFKQKTVNWQYVEALIEASQQEKVKIIRTTLMKVCERAKTLEDVFGNVDLRLAEFNRKGKGGFEYDMLYQTQNYLRQVLKELEEHELADTLELQEGINVVDLTDFSPVMQAMIVGAIAEEILRKHNHTSIVIPEAWQTIPGDRGSPATASVEALIRQGRVLHNFVLVDSQDIAGVNTKIRRHIGNYLLGKQGDEHEIERTLKAIALPAKSKPKAHEVQTLKKGQFFAVIDERVVKIYARPAWLPEENAIRVAQHPEDVALLSAPRDYTIERISATARSINVDDDVLDELENQTIQQLRSAASDLEKRLSDAKDQVKAQGDLLSAADSEKLAMVGTIQALTERVGKQELELEDARKLQEALWSFSAPRVQEVLAQFAGGKQKHSGRGENIVLEEKRSSISVERVREPVKFAEDSPEGIIVKLARSGQLDRPQTASQISKLANGLLDEGTVRATLDKFVLSPFHLLEIKIASNRAKLYGLNKEEAEEAFSKK